MADAHIPRPILDGIVRQMRSEYWLMGDKPAYLGDPGVPAVFETLLARLDQRTRERIHERAMGAVTAALASSELNSP